MTDADSFTDVNKYIQANQDVYRLYKALPTLINMVFGDVIKTHLSIFKDYEEDWDSLRIEIESNDSLDSLFNLESQLFTLLSKNASYTRALEFITISFISDEGRLDNE